MPAPLLAPAFELSLSEVVREMLVRHPDALIVSTCGFTSRELFNAADRPENFYLVGSMGMSAPVALGLALARPERTVIALDGDGSLLMNLSVLPLVAASGTRLLHVVVDNGMHESTGGSPPCSAPTSSRWHWRRVTAAPSASRRPPNSVRPN